MTDYRIEINISRRVALAVIAAVVVVLLLAGCPDPQPTFSKLVCTLDGQETYRAATAGNWIYTEGSWWNRYDDQQYKPSALESCHTEDK